MAAVRLQRLVAICLAALVVLAAAGGAWARGDSRYGVYVQDEAGIISGQTRDELYRQATWLNERTGTAQVGIVTVNDLGGITIEEYAVAKFRELGLGGKESHDGVLLLYAEREKRVRIEVGYGMEGRIPDGKAGAILDRYFVPNRNAGRFDEAFFLTQSALIREMAAEYGIDASSIGSADMPAPGYGGEGEEGFWNSLPWPVKLLGAAAIVLLFLLDFKFTGGAVTYALLQSIGRRVGSSGGGRGGGGWGGRGGGGSSGGGGASR
ncbi:TPM domain-containing protein [Cohnella sp. CFH 77786]|uniref:TPM domain-containing protein n=1 Tax=Cohnella sp. CFH 77786 TaxID=2662265 RepID=UPI001C60ECCE|nr:TPM domain-containing protein [Cohnella sp. CFH 77786]MBW5446007.1 TPM domain-containing protein [Cohnella sp. CFH 77786]